MTCERCKFFKSRERLIEGRAKAARRIKLLPLSQQAHINEKYYSDGRAVRLLRGSEEN
jgi:hypothetical protein